MFPDNKSLNKMVLRDIWIVLLGPPTWPDPGLIERGFKFTKWGGGGGVSLFIYYLNFLILTMKKK